MSSTPYSGKAETENHREPPILDGSRWFLYLCIRTKHKPPGFTPVSPTLTAVMQISLRAHSTSRGCSKIY